MNLSFCQSGDFLAGMNLCENHRILPFFAVGHGLLAFRAARDYRTPAGCGGRKASRAERCFLPAGKSRNDPPVGYRETMLRTGGGRQGAAAGYEGGGRLTPPGELRNLGNACRFIPSLLAGQAIDIHNLEFWFQACLPMPSHRVENGCAVAEPASIHIISRKRMAIAKDIKTELRFPLL